MENYKELLIALYKEHAPEKIDQIDYYLDRYKGKEKQFYISQKAKYADKKPVTDSKKILAETMARIKEQGEKAKIKKEDASSDKKKEPLKKVEKVKKKEVLAQKETTENTKKEEKVVVEEKKEPLKAVPIIKKPTTEATPQKPKTKKNMDDPAININPPIKKEEPNVKPESEKEKKRRTPAIWYFLWTVFILFIIAFFIWFCIFRDAHHQDEKGLDLQKAKVENNEEVEKSDTTQSIIEKNKPNATPDQQKLNKAAQTKPTAERLYNKDVNKPAIFVACFAVKKESMAQKKVAQLKQYNLDAHYYWIPDIDANGNPFFKVVVGPFITKKDAFKSLTTVQERVNLDAYILIVD